MRRTSQLRAAFDADLRTADALNVGSHLDEELAQLDDVRFRRRVPNLGHSRGHRRRQQRRLCAGDRRLVQVHRGRLEAIWSLEVMVRPRRHACAHGLERIQMCRDRSAGREVPTRRGNMNTARAGQEGPEQEHRPTQSTDE